MNIDFIRAQIEREITPYACVHPDDDDRRLGLADELKGFHRPVSDAGRVAYNACTGAHDDLVLAVAIAPWWARSGPTTIVEPFPF
jgi:hypothetical protein